MLLQFEKRCGNLDIFKVDARAFAHGLHHGEVMPIDESGVSAMSRSLSEKILDQCFFTSEKSPPLSRLNTNEQRVIFLTTNTQRSQPEPESVLPTPQKKSKSKVVDETPGAVKNRKLPTRKNSNKRKTAPTKRRSTRSRVTLVSDDDDCDEPAGPRTRQRGPTTTFISESKTVAAVAAPPSLKTGRRGRKPGSKVALEVEVKGVTQPERSGKSPPRDKALERENGVSEVLTKRLQSLVDRLESTDKGQDDAARVLAQRQADFLAQVSQRLKSQPEVAHEGVPKSNPSPVHLDSRLSEEMKELRSHLESISNQTAELAANHSRQISVAQSEAQAVLAKLELFQQTANSQAQQLALVVQAQQRSTTSQRLASNDIVNQLSDPAVASPQIQHYFPAVGISSTTQFQPVVNLPAGGGFGMRSHVPSSQSVPAFAPGLIVGESFGQFQHTTPSQPMFRMPAQVPAEAFSREYTHVLPQSRPVTEFTMCQQPPAFSVQGPFRVPSFAPQVVCQECLDLVHVDFENFQDPIQYWQSNGNVSSFVNRSSGIPIVVPQVSTFYST